MEVLPFAGIFLSLIGFSCSVSPSGRETLLSDRYSRPRRFVLDSLHLLSRECHRWQKQRPTLQHAKKMQKFWLVTQSVVSAKASGNIVIGRSLILSFFYVLLPTTIMMFTTIREFEGH